MKKAKVREILENLENRINDNFSDIISELQDALEDSSKYLHPDFIRELESSFEALKDCVLDEITETLDNL